MPSSAATDDLAKRLAALPSERWPRHIAIIMDGNGRWAQRQGMPRVEGHNRGGGVVRAITRECARLGHIEQLTLYCLSSENWKRPAEELAFLMQLLKSYLVDERPIMMEDNVRVGMIGRREGIPDDALEELDRTVALSAENTGLRLNLAINYGGRGEIADAVRSIAGEVAAGGLQPDQIDEGMIARNLYTAGAADPDLLIRTAGEMRISNFLLWQISYAEIWVTDRCWPDFDEGALHEAIIDYASRERRFGGLSSVSS
ncbi:Decaprenyl diphosphate synthase-like protein [Pseudobythopirellula maris]|uniref:Isoprenyl transferase n=1 Tax=Pseudobythopirellula maris TaxID=2527991 RepID=A0A5C5ZMR5_9BACT|nr:isoprenyl transferase [Pseudobythopirellula maris]TWT88365.1 Decaprenyl diphosphate synthase-like protein [Pseudobythopirellula maris]